ncbi:MAG TPA: hypothetical protein VGN84_00215 [Solirubrobacterales bacterium]|jgi:hypothetical protein|nr:hypothetical protein [Solirubrobacterales bacterium]
MQNKPRRTYANVVSTLALCLALSGGVAYAATKVNSKDLAKGAVHTPNVYKRAITSGKLAVGAVRSNQVVDGAIGSKQLADSAVGIKQVANAAIGSKQIGAGAVAPSNLEFPVFYAASPKGGSAPVTAGPDPYPLSGGDTWTQNPGQIEVVFGAVTATIAYDGSGPGSCQVFLEVLLNGQQVGGGGLSTGSTSLEQVEQSVGAQPQIDPLVPTTNHLTMRAGSNGACTPDSTIDSARFRVLDFG